MNHSLNNRLSKLESSYKVNDSLAHLTDDELLAELKALQLRNDEVLAGNSSELLYNDSEIIRLETELAEMYGLTRDEWRAMCIQRFLKKQENNR